MRVHPYQRGLSVGPWARTSAVALVATLWLLARLATADPLIDALAADDPRALGDAVAAIERAPTSPELADALFAAGRASEDRLLDPARALALYERILRELPDARVATSAHRRAERLRIDVGPRGEHAKLAAELADLAATADRLEIADLLRRADALAAAPWPRAPDAALWAANVLRRTRRFSDAQVRYARILELWPGTAQAVEALRGATGNAIDAHDWTTAERLVQQLPSTDPEDAILREDLQRELATAHFRARLYLAAWIALGLALALLLASLAEAILRGGVRVPSPRPPIEVLYLAPVAIVFVATAYTGNLTVAPAVAMITLGGLGLAWISGTTLDLLRTRARPVRLRALLHVGACLVAALALGYIMLTRDNLMDMLVETVRFGPE